MSQSKKSEDIENLSIEELFEKVRDVVSKLEDEDIPLDDAFGWYENGVVLMKSLSDKLSGVQERVKKITSDGSFEIFEEE